jgi:hypothetical protein
MLLRLYVNMIVSMGVFGFALLQLKVHIVMPRGCWDIP